eukprot:2772286-Rhodomonas_salina.2
MMSAGTRVLVAGDSTEASAQVHGSFRRRPLFPPRSSPSGWGPRLHTLITIILGHSYGLEPASESQEPPWLRLPTLRYRLRSLAQGATKLNPARRRPQIRSA